MNELLKVEHFVGTLQDDRDLDFQTCDEPGPLSTSKILVKKNSKMAVDSKGTLYVTGPLIIDAETGFAKASVATISPKGVVGRILFDATRDITSIAINSKDQIYVAEYASAYSEAGRGGSEYSMFPILDRLGRDKSYFKVHILNPNGNTGSAISKTTNDMFFNFAVTSTGTLYAGSYWSLRKFSTTSFFGNRAKDVVNYKTNPYAKYNHADPKPVNYIERSANKLVVDKADNLYFTELYTPMKLEPSPHGSVIEGASGDPEFDTIKRLSPDGKIELIAGSTANVGSVAGIRETAGFRKIEAMTTDDQGNLYVYEQDLTTIRKVDKKGMVTVLINSPDISNVMSLAFHANSLYLLKKDGIGVIRNIQ